MACAARGFLRDRAGDRAAAEAEWRKGLYESWSKAAVGGGAPERMGEGSFGLRFVSRSMLASLTGELSDDEAQRIIADVLTAASDASPLQLGAAGSVPLRPGLLREMWRTPRGRDVARRYAFRDLDVAEYFRLPLVLGAYEFFRQGALPPTPTPEQDQLAWDAAEHGYREFYFNRLSKPQVLQLALAWKGVGGPLGWDGVAPRLESGLRAKLAYLLALKRGRTGVPPAELEPLLRTAEADAGDDARLRTLARAARAAPAGASGN
jgi:hypothetical protein